MIDDGFTICLSYETESGIRPVNVQHYVPLSVDMNDCNMPQGFLFSSSSFFMEKS